MHLLIIGGGAAGATAAFEGRKFNQDVDITIVSSDRYTHYSPCGLPFAIGGQVPDVSDLIVYPPSFYKMSDIDLHLGTTVTQISPQEKKVRTSNSEIEYDRLIIATGSSPIIPPIEGVDKDGVYTLKGIDDGQQICAALSGAKQVVVIGAGLIGLEMATAFKMRGLQVKVIEMEERPLPHLLDEDMAAELTAHLEGEGIEFYFGKRAEEIIGKEKAGAVLVDKEEIPCCIVLLACGVNPNVELARQAGIELGSTGQIKVDSKMQTSYSEIYAAGDCVVTPHLLTNRPIQSMSRLGSTATRQGKVAGINAVGGDLRFCGSLNTTITELAGLVVGVVGLDVGQAREEGFEPISVRFEGPSRDPFFPEGEKIVLKMVADNRTYKIIGMQIMGREGIFGRILAVSLAIQKGITVDELAQAETCYVPSISPTFDPITLAAEMLMRRMSQ